MTVDKSLIGRPTGASTVVIERGPVTAFAKAVTDENPVFASRDAARAAGFDDIPTPPIYAFSAMGFWGQFPEDQPEGATPGTNPMMEIIGGLMKQGGMVLHGEQEFEYHRPLLVGERVHGEGKVVDIYEKESKGKTMTFVVTENVYRDDAGDPVLTTRMNLIHRS